MSTNDHEHDPKQNPDISPESIDVSDSSGQNDAPETPRNTRVAPYTGAVVIRENLGSEGLPEGVYTVIDEDGDIKTIFPADPVDLSGLQKPEGNLLLQDMLAPPEKQLTQDILTPEEQQKIYMVKNDLARLQLLSGGLELLLESRPAVDPSFEGDRAKLVEAARLSALRLIRDMSELKNVVYSNHLDNSELADILRSVSDVLDDQKVTDLQRLFVGGYRGKNAERTHLSHEVSNAVARKGLRAEESTSRIVIKGKKGLMLFVSESDDQPE